MHHEIFDLSDRVALVTGASRGIGAAIARLLAAHGAHVVVTSRDLASCREVATEICAAGDAASARSVDIGDVESVETLINGIGEELGQLDILVNNAATNPFFGHILDTSLDAFQKTVDVNMRGYFVASRAAARWMQKSGGGSIINIASVNAVRPIPNQGVYAMTKAAVVNMTQAFAKECAAMNIRANAVLPGFTKTAFASALFDDERTYRSIIQMIPMRRHADPEEIAGTVLYLASAASTYTTGAVIPVDGGALA